MSLDGVFQPVPAPRLSRTPGKAQEPGKPGRSGTKEILQELGYNSEEIEILYENAVVE